LSRQPPALLFARALGDSLLSGFVGAQLPATAAPLFVRQHPDAVKILTIVLLLGFTCVCLGEPSQKEPSITKKDRTEIEAVIKKQTGEKILTIRRESKEGVEVTTGVVTPGRLEGKGHTFWLKRTKKGWEVQKRGLWVS
jgi:hypothetical protein